MHFLSIVSYNFRLFSTPHTLFFTKVLILLSDDETGLNLALITKANSTFISLLFSFVVKRH